MMPSASKTITSPAVPNPTSTTAERDAALSFLQSTTLDALEVMYRTGFCRPGLYWAAERRGIVQADVDARLSLVDAEVHPAPTPIVRGSSRCP